MSKTNPIDEAFGFHTPDELDIVKIAKYFEDLERSVNVGSKVLRYSDDEEAKSVIDGIVNEFSWVEDDIYKLIQFYEDAQELIGSYRSLAEDRMTEDETYEYNTILVRNKLEAVK